MARKWKLKKINAQKIEETLNEMAALAFESGKVYLCSIRCQRNKSGDVIIQLKKDTFCLISSKGEGFNVSNNSDEKFDWPKKQQDLPIPQKIPGEELIKLLLEINNLEKDEEIYLLLTYILKSLVIDSGANPIAILQGSQGSSKSTSSNNIKRIIDPTMPLLISPPKSELEVLTTANSSSQIAYDNMSGFSNDLADTFCRLSTGGGISKRALYTDDDEISYNLLKSLLFNGIDEASNRPDFNDRAIVFHLKRIPFDKRKSEAVLKENFEKNYPKIIGGIYDLLSKVLLELPSIRNERLPRMTEYARFGMALEKVLNLSEGFFLELYASNIKDKIETNFWNDEICNAIFAFFYIKKPSNQLNIDLLLGEYFKIGTAEELRSLFFRSKDKSSNNYFFKTAKSFSEHLKRIEPLLNEKKIRIERDRSSNRREIKIFAAMEPDILQEMRDKDSLYFL